MLAILDGPRRVIGQVVGTAREFRDFLKSVAADPRIPARDKRVLLALVALLISPFDLIPDWIPIFGQLDDLMMAALILDYFFAVLPEEVLLSHYPWGLKSFGRLRRAARVASWITPERVKRWLWTQAVQS